LGYQERVGRKGRVEDKLRKGLKLTLDTSFNTVSGKKDATFKTNYKHDYFNLNLDSALALSAPVINAAGVFSYQGWLAGGSVSLDTAKQLQGVKKSQLAIGYSSPDLKIHTYIKDLQEFGAQVYHKVNAKTEVGIDINWVGSSAATKFALAAKRKLDADSFANFTVDNKSIINLGYTNSIRKGVKLTGSLLLDAKALSGGDHKVGLGLDLEL
jgi:voltage-dependent anion channel protein 2